MKSKNSRKIIVHILLLLGITITVFPFVWMILTSFKTVGEAMQIPPTIFSDRCVFIYRNSTSVWKSIFEHNYINCGNNCCTGVVLLYGSLCICKNRIPV